MPIEKPTHIDDDVWKQHLDWMRVMTEGQLTDDIVIKARKDEDKPRSESK